MELLHIADVVAREKGIDQREVVEGLEQALSKAAKAKYGADHDIRVVIDNRSGGARFTRYREVVADGEVAHEVQQIELRDALKEKPDAQIGDFLTEELPPIDFTRLGAQSAKQIIHQHLRDADRGRQFEEFKDRVGEVIIGTVKQVEYGHAIIDLMGRGQGIMRRDEQLPRENYKPGDRVRAYIYDVRPDARGPMVMLSRTHPQFMARLFTQEVPEIYDGLIEIKGVARDPGSRAKMAVYTRETSIDPVGACVGMRGSRVQAVVGELQGEKVDIIPWTPDTANFVVNALAPAQVAKVVLDEEAGRVEVVVPDEQLSLAIGRRGQNVRLASMLTGLDIDILTEAEESERRTKETTERTSLFMQVLDVDDVIAHLLVAEGFTSIEEVAYIETDELAGIEGFGAEIASELQQRAQNYINAASEAHQKELADLGVTPELAAFEGLTHEMLVALGKNGVKTLDDFADLASDELIDFVGASKLKRPEADALIMKARESWFAEENAQSNEGGGESTT